MYPQPGFLSSKKTYVDTGCSVTNRVEANTQQEVKIEKLEKIYCDDFVCTSSPSVELAVRSFARELELLKMSPRLFSKDVVFGDGVRSFKGNSRYSRMRWISENVRKPEVVIERLQMLSQETARVDWRLTGQVASGSIDIPVQSTIEMNVLTGRILSHKDSWDTSRLSPPVSLLVAASRATWAAKQAAMDAQEKLKEAADSLTSTLETSMNDDSAVYRDPTDPTKFFQQSQKQDNQNDMINFAMIAIAMWAVYKGFSTVIQL